MPKNTVPRSRRASAPKTNTTTKPAAELPDWATKTPSECDYYLEMCRGGSDPQPCETVNMTRAEYLELKNRLAKMRGYKAAREVEHAA